ncbi:MAG: LacI family DNA-binding transcriptional regulator [Burkholderiales bacterium]|nr:LacI family DNA-binding transcriptional regulator [Burkholderiales bacterium]
MARLAGVSPATVSRALREPHAVSPPMRARIDAAVDRLSYRRNLMAGGLASARSMTIGVIIPSMTNAFFAATIDGMEAGLAGTGYQLLIGNSRYGEDTEERLIASLLAWSPAAIVVTGCRHSRGALRMLLDAKIPVVEMWELSDRPIDTVVGFSQHAAGAAAARHLIDRGATRLGFVGALLGSDYRAGDRRAGFRAAAAAAGFAPPAEAHMAEQATAVGGAKALSQLMDAHPDVDAVLCSNDVMALGAIFEAQRRGWPIPHRLKLCGFGDMDFAAATEPALTTLRPPRRAIGARIAEILRERFEGTQATQTVFDLGFELVVRGST